jgi:hypothetical protein
MCIDLQPFIIDHSGSKPLTAREDHSCWLYDLLDHLCFTNVFDPLSNIWNAERSASQETHIISSKSWLKQSENKN